MILIPFYARVLGAAEYGKVLAAMSLFNVVWMVVQYGFPFIGMRDVASTADKVIIAAHFGVQIRARLLTAAIGIAVGAVATACSPLLKSEPAYGVIATALGVVSAFNLAWYFQATHRFRTLTFLERCRIRYQHCLDTVLGARCRGRSNRFALIARDGCDRYTDGIRHRGSSYW